MKNEINMNGECRIYINSNYKNHALILTLHRHYSSLLKSLMDKMGQCKHDHELAAIQSHYNALTNHKRTLDAELSTASNQIQIQYSLCQELVHENDVRICRRKVKQRGVQKIGGLIMKSPIRKYNIDA